MKRTMILVLIMTTGLGVLAYTTYARPRTGDVKVIKITAKKFDFTPNELTVKKGEPVTLELTATDRVMDSVFRISSSPRGSSLAKLLALPSLQTGRENSLSPATSFAGAATRDMAGRLIVTD